MLHRVVGCQEKHCQTVSSKPVSGGKPGRVVRTNGCGQ